MNLNSSRRLFPVIAIAVLFLFLGLAFAQQQQKQASQPAKAATNQATSAPSNAQVARGQYIVTSVAMCTNCHTQRDAKGELESEQSLKGASVFFQPAYPIGDWPQKCPRIAGNPPGTDDQMVTLLTTGIWKTGARLRQPMPQFRMTKEDAEAVVAYLKSLR